MKRIGAPAARESRVSNMPNSDRTGRVNKENSRDEYLSEGLIAENDIVIEQIIENVNNTPLGQVLKRIANLPEMRQKKVLDVRHSLAEGQYDFNNRLDIALDKVLEELTS